MTTYLGVSEAASRIGARPRDLTRLFYDQVLRTDLCPKVGGRRVIPPSYLPTIAMALKHRNLPVADDLDGIDRAQGGAIHVA